MRLYLKIFRKASCEKENLTKIRSIATILAAIIYCFIIVTTVSQSLKQTQTGKSKNSK